MRKFFMLYISLISTALFAQDDLMNELEQNQNLEANCVTQTFKGTRIIQGQSVETKGKGEMEFILTHRFGSCEPAS